MPKKNKLYTSKILKATALIQDTMAFFAEYDITMPKEMNLQRSLSGNIFGKASRSRVEDILSIFKKRYLEEAEVAESLALLVQGGFPLHALKNIFYYHTARSDRLVYDMVTQVLFPLYKEGESFVTLDYITGILRKWVEEKKSAPWSEKTVTRVAEHLLATLRDFGILEGAANKQFAPVYLHIGAFAYISYYLLEDCRRSEEVLLHPDWELFFFDHSQVERFLLEAHQYKLLEYHAAGSVVRLDYPITSLKEYVHVILERAN